MQKKRLIETFLPIADLGEESTRERRSMTALPPIYYLHVWWARRPLIASRAAVLASILPSDTSVADFKHALGIHGNPALVKAKIDIAKKTKADLGPNPYGYARAFQYDSQPDAKRLYPSLDKVVVLDPTAGGGAIPLEAVRLGFKAYANDLNPVAALIMKATIELPLKFGKSLNFEYSTLVERYLKKCEGKFVGIYPLERDGDQVLGYLWARTVKCPYCSGTVPLSPNWNIGPEAAIAVQPQLGEGLGDDARHCTFAIVTPSDQSPGTVAAGDAVCVFTDCRRSIDGDEIKRQAQASGLGEQLLAVAFRRRDIVKDARGKNKSVVTRGYRAPSHTDNNLDHIHNLLGTKLDEWEVLDLVPNEEVPVGSKTDEARRYGMTRWRDLFSPRQLLAQGFCAEAYRELLDEDRIAGSLTSLREAAYIYLALGLDKLRDYNSRMTRWHSKRETIVNTFDRHDFAFKWSYAEMPHAIQGGGIAWALKNTGKALRELADLVSAGATDDLLSSASNRSGEITITNQSGASLSNISDHSVDVIVMDPPYGANVMYAELSDFFYVWLKRTVGIVSPDAFTRRLTDKQDEAVANVAHFKGEKGASKLAERDYRFKMEGIFAECRRVLNNDGIMTVMFTHKETGAWDALAMSLMDAGFVITASWPINTEASGSLHIKDKAAANSTIFLVCRPREQARGEPKYWEDVEPEVARAVKERVGEFQAAGIQGVDLYLASFGPALEAFSRHWPLTRGTPAPEPKRKRRTQSDLFEVFDPYAVRPEDALNAARREVKAWRLAQLASAKAQADMDATTAFYVLAWDAFKAVSFPYDEALRLARAVGVDLEQQIIGRLAEKKAAEIKLWDSATRVAKGAIGPADGSRGMIDALHHAAHVMRTRGAEATQEMLENAGVAREDSFKVAMEALLEVLPPSKTFSGIDAEKAVKPAADDFDALETLRRIAYAGEIGEPQQLELYREMMAAE